MTEDAREFIETYGRQTAWDLFNKGVLRAAVKNELVLMEYNELKENMRGYENRINFLCEKYHLGFKSVELAIRKKGRE